jgi:hypothetical protein
MTITTADCRDFYQLRDRRSVEYLSRKLDGRSFDDLRPVHIAIDAPTTSSRAGQLAVLALANQLARVCRRVSFDLPHGDVPVLISVPLASGQLADALLDMVRRIDPCGDFRISDAPKSGALVVGLGAEPHGPCDWYLGADRSVGLLARTPRAFTDFAGTLRGAAVASCLGCAAILRTQMGLPVVPRELSAWNYAEGESADFGPESLETFDIGRVLMAGAGAVGAAAAFWLYAFGCSGEGWDIVDGDDVELHNTNRGMLFLPSDAGWPSGDRSNKAELASRFLPAATAHPLWWDKCRDLDGRKFDVVLALANDRSVREQLTHLNAPVAFQATTSDNWGSQLHRHVLGRDGCIWCRTGTIVTPQFACSTVQIEQEGESRSDAALPFLSAASGLMLVTALQRLVAGDLAGMVENCWSWDFDSSHRLAERPTNRRCRSDCALVPNARARQLLVATSRWAGLVR